MSDYLFHVMRVRDHVVVYRMQPAGQRTVYLPARDKTVPEVWPQYGEYQPYLDAWFERSVGQPLTTHTSRTPARPGDERYPRYLAHHLNAAHLGFWAYVTDVAIWVSLSQVAAAMGRHPRSGAEFRAELQDRGLVVATERPYGGCVSLAAVAQRLGGAVADRIVLSPTQIAGFLGLKPSVASDVVRRLGLHLEGRGNTAAEWGQVRRVRRVGQRTFELVGERGPR